MDLRRRHLLANAGLYTLGTLGLLGAAPAVALAQVSVEVSPLRVELKTNPSGTTTQAITISNTGKDPVRVRATISNWYLSLDGAPQFGDAEGVKYSASDWIRLAPPEQVIESSKDGAVRFTLTVPPGTDPAGYRTSVLFEFGPASGDLVARGRDVVVRSRIATLIYVNIGEPPAAVELTDLKSRRTPDQPIQIVAVLKNTGRRSVRTRGTLALYDKTGGKVSETQVPDVPVLPESEREVAVTAFDPVKTQLPAGDYRVELKIDVGMPALIVGETTLKVM
jgi:P pilus assembly chaperone PapD